MANIVIQAANINMPEKKIMPVLKQNLKFRTSLEKIRLEQEHSRSKLKLFQNEKKSLMAQQHSMFKRRGRENLMQDCKEDSHLVLPAK